MKIDNKYYKKTVKLDFKRIKLNFDVSQSLFSSQDIDIGTKRLLRTFEAEESIKNKKILDLGCGYGPIGITLGKFSDSNHITLTDKDSLAISYTNRNILLNDVSNCNAYSSLGYDDINEKDFDLIVSNIPAKVGDKVMKSMLLDAENYLNPEGKVAIVVIEAINDLVHGILNIPDKIKIIKTYKWNGHVVYHYKFIGKKISIENSQSSFIRGYYERQIFKLNFAQEEFPIQTTYNLPEFDSLNIETELALKVLMGLKHKKVNKIAILNTGQGHLAVAASKIFDIKKIELVDRDLQSLRISKKNLELNKIPVNKVFINQTVGVNLKSVIKPDIFIAKLDTDDGQIVNDALFDQIATLAVPNSIIVATSGSTVITRLEKNLSSYANISKVDRKKNKRKSTLVLKHK